jgi:two-component system nitrogen regulation sensor histidine kinase NtrY
MLNSKTKLYLVAFSLFLVAGLSAAYIAFQPESPASVAKRITANLQDEIHDVEEDFDFLALHSSEYSFDPGKFHYPFFIYEDDRLVYWSDNTYIPPLQSVMDTFQIKLTSTTSEAYLIFKRNLGSRKFVVSTVSLFRKYPINNDYLVYEWNEKILPSANISIADPSTAGGEPVCILQKCVFKISFISDEFYAHKKIRIAALIFFVAALMAFLALAYQQLPRFHRHREFGFLYLALVFMLIRIIMSYTNFPGNLIRSSLFDPKVFASSALSASLGDQFINLLAALALCYFLFKNYFHFSFLKYRNHNYVSWCISTLSSVFILFAGLFTFVMIQTFYNNSTIVLDISQSLIFNSIRIVAILSVLISGICSFFFLHVFIRMLVSDGNITRMRISFGIAIVLFILANEFTGQQYISSLIITSVYVAIIYFLKLYASLSRLSYATFSYLFICIFFLAANTAYGIQYFSRKKKIENQFRFANNFLIDRDIFGEYLLHETSQKIASDLFTQTRMVNPFLGKETIRQKIRQIFLPSYFNKYDVDIYIFNSIGEPIENSSSHSLADFINQYERDPYRTDYEGIFYISNPESDITQKYLIKIPIRRANSIAGYVLIELSLKKVIPENVYPELLVDYQFQEFYRTQELNYAVFTNKNLVFSSGEFDYDLSFDQTWMGNPSLYYEGLSIDGYDHIAQEDQNERVAVVSTKQVPFVYHLANFSFLLVLGLLIILLMIFLQGIYFYFRGIRLFFSARIQLYLNLAFFIPLIIVSVTALGLASRSSQQQLAAEYLNKSKTFAHQMTHYLDDYLRNQGINQMTVSSKLSDLAKLSNLDANIYSRYGTLMATSQPLIFENHLLSEYINPNAYARAIGNGENLFIESEKVGRLQYFVAYATLKSPQRGELIGILGIPFFQSAYLLDKIQIGILINILNVFAFIFIVLLALSYIVAERLTFPLRFITQSLRRTSLTQINAPLTWHAHDEIGLMVKEYNSMLYKLSESKSELERTQREKAWREIAQQVAHEIKNPLTPMKLTLQQLERSVQSGNNVVEKTQRAITTLLEQVDTLNDIASSFSGFAKMPEPVIQELELVALVKRAVDLHSPTGEIIFKTYQKEAWVMGDDQLLSRTLSNIILNGLQAAKPGQSIQVNVVIERSNGSFIRTTIYDNGKGIEPQIADRIFLPHFTTKKSGSGLGLAIAKQAIEQMNGRLWFETQVGKGTSFFIELPELDSPN